MDITEKIIASDGWYIENDEAWFIGTCYNGIFKAHLKTLECKLVCDLPLDDVWVMRYNPRCVKIGENIVCLPERGKDVLLYNIEKRRFDQLRVAKDINVDTSIFHYWKEGNSIVAFSRGLQKVLTIDVEKRRVNLSNKPEEKTNIMYAIKVDNFLWMTDCDSKLIYSYNLFTEEWNSYDLPQIRGGVHTICHDGSNFWITGKHKEIYSWDKDSNNVVVYDNFPNDFGMYSKQSNTIEVKNIEYEEQLFSHCLFLNDAIWCIPFQANMVLKIDLQTHVIDKVIDDDETVQEIFSRNLSHKYLLEYVRDKRYIGLYSLKRECIFEIDTTDGSIQDRQYRLMNLHLMNRRNAVFRENGVNSFIFHEMLKDNNGSIGQNENIGGLIYDAVYS